MKFTIYFFVLIITTLRVNAQLQLAKIFTGNMVLQQQQPITVWGRGIPGNTVHLIFGKQKKQTLVNSGAWWYIHLTAQRASQRPSAMFIYSGTQKIIIKNILIGDVWLCIGQSNMEFPMSKEMHFKDEIKNIASPPVRFYNPTYAGKNIFGVTYTDSVVQLLNWNDFFKGQWQNCDTNSIKSMSAVGYYFGKTVAEKTTIPIGLINLSVGGAPLETFIDAVVLKKDRQFSDKVKGDWMENNALPVWVRQRGRQNMGSVNDSSSDEYGKNHPYKPGFVYAAGIASLVNMPIKGIICYQGESNAQETERVKEYGKLAALMVEDYRKKWKQPELPFYYVQISSIDTIKYKGALWPQFRDEQRKMMATIPYSGMAVCSDIGFKDDVHPTDKKQVGLRLAAWALNKTYRKKNIPSGPLPQKAVYKNGTVIISFLYTGKGLQTAGGAMLQGFSSDGKTATQAFIHNKQVIIPVNNQPEFIYYGWKPFSDGNLENSALLPASTFKIKVE